MKTLAMKGGTRLKPENGEKFQPFGHFYLDIERTSETFDSYTVQTFGQCLETTEAQWGSC